MAQRRAEPLTRRTAGYHDARAQAGEAPGSAPSRPASRGSRRADAKLDAIARRLEDIAAASAQHGEQLRIGMEILRTLHDEEAANRVRCTSCGAAASTSAPMRIPTRSSA